MTVWLRISLSYDKNCRSERRELVVESARVCARAPANDDGFISKKNFTYDDGPHDSCMAPFSGHTMNVRVHVLSM